MKRRSGAARAAGFWLAAAALLPGCAAPNAAGQAPPAPLQIEPARIAHDVAWLADDAREGRGVGTPGIAAAAAYLAEGFRAAGFAPGGDDGSFLQRFEMPIEIHVETASLSLRGAPLARGADFEPFLASADGTASGTPVFAGYGISAPELGYDDYEGIDVSGRIVLVIDDRPTGEKSPLRGPQAAELLRRAYKIANARARGAVAVLVAPAGPTQPNEPLPGNAGRDWANPTQQAGALPSIAVSWPAASRIVAAAGGMTLAERKALIDAKGRPNSALLPGAELALAVAVERRRGLEANVVAILEGSDPVLRKQAVVIGAHYDHLGRGEFGSLAPDRRGEIHNGADDNASGSAALLELARAFGAQPRPRRSLVLAAFSGEEAGLVGSREYAAAPPIPMASTVAMVNLDMIGRLRSGTLFIFGTETSPDFPNLVGRAAEVAKLGVNLSQGSFSPSDQTSFLAQGVPVLFFFTGTHGAYHTPDDDADQIDAAGEASVVRVVYEAARELLNADGRPTLIEVPHQDVGPGGAGYGPYLGTIPDFGGKPGTGVLIQGVRKGSPAETAGLRAGDRIVEFDGVAVANLEEYAALLFGAHTGQRVVIVVERGGERIAVEAVLGAAALMLVVYGAGAVGLVVGARLARAGLPVLLVTRRQAAAKLIHELGVRVEDPSAGSAFEQRVPSVCGIEAAAERIQTDPVLFCMRSSDTAAAARALFAVAPEATVASLQNDVDNEPALAAMFPRVIGGVVRQTSTRTADNCAVAVGEGRIAIGLWPSGDAPFVQGLADGLRRAGYDVGVSTRIAEDKWLKLCVNLMSAPNALIRREDHATQAFVEIKARLLEEARAILHAAGIPARSCDGRDRSLEQEIAHQRASLALGTSARAWPVYNQVWAALRQGGPVEADRYHRRMLELAGKHGIAAPQNARVLAALERAVEGGLGPESLAAADLLVSTREAT